MKLYYTPYTCSLGIHLLLEEIGKPFTLEKVDFATNAQYSPAYVALNPKSKVPLLQRDDGSLLTEFPAIAFYLARANPEARLLPPGIEGEAQALEILDYLISTVQMRGFARIFRPGNFSPTASDVEVVQQAGREMIVKSFAILEPVLGDKEFFLGEFSIVESALFFLEFWARTRAGITLPKNFEAHLDRLLARPATQRVLATEGLSASAA